MKKVGEINLPNFKTYYTTLVKTIQYQWMNRHIRVDKGTEWRTQKQTFKYAK